MAKFVIAPHMRLHEWVARDNGYFSAEGLDCEWQTRGLLFVLVTAKGMDHFAHTDRLLRSRFAMPARPRRTAKI